MTIRLSVTFLFAAALALLAPVAAHAQPPPGSERSSFSERIDVNVVNLDVRVEDKAGKPVTDLTLADFEVIENGRKVDLLQLSRQGMTTPMDETESGAPDPAAEDPEMGRSRSSGAPAAATGAAGAPLRLAILVDLDHSRPSDRERIAGELRSFLSRQTPAPSVMVTTYSLGGVRMLLPFSESSEEWSRALEAAIAGPTRAPMRDLEQQQILTDIGEALKTVRVDRSMAASLLHGLIARAQHHATEASHDSRAMIGAIEHLSGALAALPGPKSLLYVGDGFAIRPGAEVFDLLSSVFEDDRRFGDRSVVAGGAASGGGSASDGGGTGGERTPGGAVVSLPPRTASPLLRTGAAGVDLSGEVEALAAAANSERVTFYAISSMQPGNLGAGAEIGRGAKITGIDSPSGLTVFESSRLDALQESLDYVAEATGGLTAASGADVGRFLERMGSHSRSYYSLAYELPDPEQAGLRRVKVKVKRKGLRVHHREEYVAKRPAERISDLLAGALLLRTGENGHGIRTGLASQQTGEGETWNVALGLEIPIGELDLLPAGDAHRAELQVYVLTMNEHGRLSEVQVAPLAFTIRDDELAQARTRRFVASFPLVLARGRHEVAVGLSEPGANRLSVARTSLELGATN